MSDFSFIHKSELEVVLPGRPQVSVALKHFPFLIGRDGEAGNDLELEDSSVSYRCAAIVSGRGGYCVEDRGNRTGVYVNGERVTSKTLHNGDTISFNSNGSPKLIFRSTSGRATIARMLNRMKGLHGGEALESAGLSNLNLLLEATSLLHSHLPLISVLNAMLDHAIAVTKADRGMLLEVDDKGVLQPRLARNSEGVSLPPESMAPNEDVLSRALQQQTGVVVGDPELARADSHSGAETVHVDPHSFIATPLYALAEEGVDGASAPDHGELLGAIYLDSTHPAGFSELVRHIFDALGVEAASILDNARHVERERERRLMEHELGLARAIQQALLPRGFKDFPHLTVSGVNHPCIAVGGDYFDVFPVNERQTAVLIADVSGHGLGAALLTTMLQGALSGMTLGEDPLRVFNQINQFLCEHSEVGHYATMFFSLVDVDGTLHYIQAAHPSPLILRNGSVIQLCTGGSFPVGLIPEATFQAERFQLEPGDTMILYSDGVTEAADPDEAMFGMERLKEAAAGHDKTSLDELKHLILDAVDKFSRGAPQDDDITVLIARYEGSK